MFIGFANFYWQFIEGFSCIVAPLTALVKDLSNSKKKNQITPIGGILTLEAQDVFNTLKTAFLQAPVLIHFDPEKPIWVKTEASGWAIGAILTQPGTTPNDSHWHPVAYFSQKMTSSEWNYETHNGGMLAIVEAFKQWRHYLEGAWHQTSVLTDHHNLKKFMETKRLSRRQICWAQGLIRCHGSDPD